MGEAGEGADPEGAVLLVGHAPQLIQHVDAHKLFAGTLSFPDLDQHVTAAGNDLGLRMLHQKLYRVGYALSLIERFDIIHRLLPP